MAEVIVNKYSESGICYPRISINIRTAPCATTGVILDQYLQGESVIYDQVVKTDKYVWISWLSTSGRRVYMAIKDQVTGERFGDCADIANSSVGTETIVQEYPESGICYPKMTINIRDLPCSSTGSILDQYYQGESVIYDYVVKTDKYVWISWISRSGARRYMAVKDQSTGERFADCGDVPGGFGESNTPTGSEPIINEYSESGICYPDRSINIRNIPCSTTGVVLDQYHLGESVIYDYVVITNKYVWISWTGISGRRVYMTVKDQVTGERWANCTDISDSSGGSGNYSGVGIPGVQKVFIDAGHGGNDPGACGNGLKEKDIVLAIAQKLTDLFKAKGIQVSHSRYSDNSVELAERAEMANKWGADIFISIHANALDGSGSAYGTECYTYPNSTAENKRLATDIATSISRRLVTYNRGFKEADFAVLRLTSMPAVLVETAFIDNVGDANKLRSRQGDFAQAIFDAVMGKSIGGSTTTPEPDGPVIKPMKHDTELIAEVYDCFAKLHPWKTVKYANEDTGDYIRSKDYTGLQWDLILGSPSGAVQALAISHPQTGNKLYKLATDNIYIYDREVDIAHLIATALGYRRSIICPAFWTGWGGDLATLIGDIAKNRNAEKSELETAYELMGSKDYSFSKIDLEADIDAIAIAKAYESKRLDRVFEDYFAFVTNSSRKELFLTNDLELSKSASFDEIYNKVKTIMTYKGFGFAFEAGGHLLKKKMWGQAAGAEVYASTTDAGYRAFAKYIYNLK